MIRWSRALLCFGAALVSLSCRDFTGGEPFSLSATWGWTSGVDWGSYFNLTQEGTQVEGECVYMVPGTGPIDTVRVTGNVKGRHVTLQWAEPWGAQFDHYTLNGVVSLDGQTVTTTVSVNGGAPMQAAPLVREH